MSPRECAEFVLDPLSADGRPAKGERLWLMVVGKSIEAWSSGREPPSTAPEWAPCEWRPEWDEASKFNRSGAPNALRAVVAREIERAAKRHVAKRAREAVES